MIKRDLCFDTRQLAWLAGLMGQRRRSRIVELLAGAVLQPRLISEGGACYDVGRAA